MLNLISEGEFEMAKRLEVSVFDNSNANGDWALDEKYEYEPLWDLAHGENSYQPAGILKSENMADYEVIGGKILTYNEVLNITELANILSEFYDVCAVAIAKHFAPCGVALAPTIEEAYDKAFDCDPVSSFFGSIGASQKIDFEMAKHISSMSVKMLIAPDFDAEAIDLLSKHSSMKLVKLNTPLKDYKKLVQKEIKVTPFGTLYQMNTMCDLTKESFKIVTKAKPTKEQIEDGVFAWKVSKYSRSNSIIIAKDFKTVAIAQGLMSPVTAVEIAMDTACDASKGAVLVADNTLPTIDCVNMAAQGRISMIIQPGGSANDKKLIELADNYNIAMVITGIKNYKQ